MILFLILIFVCENFFDDFSFDQKNIFFDLFIFNAIF